LDILAFSMLVLGSILSGVWIVLLVVGISKYGDYFDEVNLLKNPLKPILPLALVLVNTIAYDFSMKKDRQRMQACRNIYGADHYEFEFYQHFATKISVLLTLIVITALIYPLTGVIGYMIMGGVATIIAFVAINDSLDDKDRKRQEELIRDFPGVLSKIALLVNAEVIIDEAWKIVAKTGNGVIFTEMRKTESRMVNSMTFGEALVEFGNDCGHQDIKKISSVIAQKATKGSDDIDEYLQLYSKEMWEEKKHLVRRQGEKASSKLLIPIGLMFLGILALIGIPLVSNLQI